LRAMNELRKLLFPFALIYRGILFARNKLYDIGWISSKSYPFPVICVGNLRVGGTGKSPMIEYLLCLFGKNQPVAVLSRGYKRSSKGFFLLKGTETAKQVGDEPLQFKRKFPWASIAVDEKRQHGIETLRELSYPPEVVLLDDAFQHRKVRAGLSILLTSYGDLYSDDSALPVGNLREPKSGAKRADIIVVTKCPLDLSVEKQNEIRNKLNPEKHQSLYFAGIQYSAKVTNGVSDIPVENLKDFTLVTGIADPRPLIDFLGKSKIFEHKKFSDHHNFTPSELEMLRKEKLIVTTEKDFMRLKSELKREQLFYLPIQMELIGTENGFENEIKEFVENHKITEE
ncbi:MAG TPA: tetraacyldisaccharide 4'-kinase, partial [Flavobacteriaceae bacterium]|nr:tetraacyldisaccharide 4'-kinase [Flavobacteriaceae bacterium]